MAIRISLHHRTEYHFDRLVNLSPHTIRLRPAPHTRTPVHQYSLTVEPEDHFINWMQDPFGNFIGRFVFPEKTRKFVVDVNLVADLITLNPFDFFVEEYAEKYPFKYETQLQKELVPYFEIKENGEKLTELLAELRQAELGLASTRANEASNLKHKEGEEVVPTNQAHIVHFLVALTHFFEGHIGYTIRMEPGVQTCEETLARKTGSCRDTAWLLVQVLRHFGLAARFVSGYLVQLTADEKSLDGPSGPEQDFTDLHAWAEVFVPGAGWVGLDPTSGLFAGEGHIPLACTPDPVSAAPIVGATDKCEVSFQFKNEVTRIHEDPRVTKPYSDQQWDDIQRLGAAVDQKLLQGDVRLTMGGEPTFVSIDDMDHPQWNIAALGDHKLQLAQELFLRIRDNYSHNAALHYGQGKWYPGEQLPRWALTCAWLKNGGSIWTSKKLLDSPTSQANYTVEQAQQLMQRIAKHLELNRDYIKTAYEDVPYYLWKEGTLPVNVDVHDNKLSEEMERKRISRIFDQGLNQIAGFTLPVAWSDTFNKWHSSRWEFRREQMFLIPGDSAMGYRLPLDSIQWEPKAARQKLIDKDPFDEFDNLPEMRDRLHVILNENLEPWHETPVSEQQSAGNGYIEEDVLIRTALCVEPRNGHLHVFLPPLTRLEHYLDLINAIEVSAVELNTAIIMEGYEPPHDPRLQRISVTPDPGVIEVNIHPSESWDDLVKNTTTLYEQARLSRLGTEKFMLDGRHSGTGGGNHITIGAAKPVDSPILRRPHLLKSLLTYWQNHPSLSYLFSGLFMGPTSQSPRVDEARDDALYELGIALSEMTHDESSSPWLVDRLLRNLLVDLTGNTHRAEFCIDKLYSPTGSAGRLGIVEFRGFEMPPHARMSLVQALLLRTLIARFWDKPYEQKLVPWGTELHDRFMLPHYVERDMRDVVDDLNREGFDFDFSWFDPFIEFRFPRYGVINIDDVELELRFAIEPWHVLGEEVTAMGTSRYVDSSVERLQVKVKGMTDGRHVITCNGRRVPLRNTGTVGEYVGGVRYKAWHPPSALHPTIVTQAPLVFDIVDSWNQASLGGCTYHVAHPGGRSYDSFPVNANEAESRRLTRFLRQGHSGGKIIVPEETVNPSFPLTLDLRRRTTNGDRP